MAYDLLAVYPAKLQEYCLGIAYLLLFIPFWRYVQGPARAPALELGAERHPALRAGVPAGATALRPAVAGWFHVPAGVHLHPGHTWARLEADGLVTVGMDDLAQKLVGPVNVHLPAPGARVAQGEPAIDLRDRDGSVPMLSPVDGTVVAVNPAVKAGTAPHDDPYGAAWLFKVKAPRLAANLRQLHDGPRAQHLLEDASDALLRRMDPELGRVLQDGGAPVHGLARALAGEGWEAVARELFLT